MENLRSSFYRVGPPGLWEGRTQHMTRTIRRDVAMPLDPDEFDGSVDKD